MKIKLCIGMLLLASAFAPAQTNNLTALLQQGLFEEQASRNLDAAIADYNTLAAQFDKDRQLAATAVFRLGECYRAQGKTTEATAQYQRILRDFSDQTTLATLSRQNLAGMGVAKTEAVPATGNSDGQLWGRLQGKSSPELEKILPTLLSDTVLDDLLKQRNEAQSRRASLAVDYPPSNVNVLRVDAQLKELNSQLEDKITGIMQGLRLRAEPAPAVTAAATAASVPTPEAEELARTSKILAQLRGWDLSQLRRLIPTLVPDADFDRINEQLKVIEAFGDSAPDKLIEQRNALRLQLTERAQQIQLQLKQREDFLKEVAAKQNLASPVAGQPKESSTIVTTVPDEEEAEIRRIQQLIQNSPDLINAPVAGSEWTLLCVAADKAQLRVAQFLLDHGADVQRGLPLSRAASAGHKTMVELLLHAGAQVNATDGDGQTALYRAAGHGYLSVIEILLAAGADVNARAENGRTPLTLAVEKNVVPVAALLLAHGADPNIQCGARSGFSNSRGNSGAPFHFAVVYGDEPMVALLLTNRADINLRNMYGESALDIAASMGKTAIARRLIAAGADVNAAGPGGQTPLYWAAAVTPEIVAALLELGANPNIAISRSSETPLMAAASHDKPEIISLLLKHQADPNAVDYSGNTALISALINHHSVAAGSLLAGGANPNALGRNGYPALMLAVAYGILDKELLGAFIKAGANVNLPDPEGKATLHWAAENNLKDIIEMLVKAGADVNLRTKNGTTPLDYAKTHAPPIPVGQVTSTNTVSTADLLRQHGALDELPDYTRIRITRQGLSQRLTVFGRAQFLTNQFTLLETMMTFYAREQVLAYGQSARQAWVALPFPDFGRLIIRRPAKKIGGKDLEIKVSLLNSSNMVDCAHDVPVEFGDVIEIPESIHALNARTPNPVRAVEDGLLAGLIRTDNGSLQFVSDPKLLAEREARRATLLCLEKSVKLIVAGETTTFTVNPWKEGFLKDALAKTEARSVLRSSSDLTRVKVTRKTANAAKPTVITVNVSQSADQLWLQDGDVIEVPENP